MNSKMANTIKLPRILLIDTNSHQMRHHPREPVVVIAFHPNHFNLTPRVRQFANVAQKLPVFFFQAAEIQVRKNVAQQNKSIERSRLQHSQGRWRTAHFRAEMQVRNNDGIGKDHHAKLTCEWDVMEAAETARAPMLSPWLRECRLLLRQPRAVPIFVPGSRGFPAEHGFCKRPHYFSSQQNSPRRASAQLLLEPAGSS